MLKPVIAVLFTILCFFSAQGQTEWTSYYKDKQVSIDYHYADCNRPETGMYKQDIYLRFTNLTAKTLTVNYQKKAVYNGKEVQPGIENTFTLSLAPGEVLEGKCGQKDKRLYIFVKMLDSTSKSELTSFKLQNIQVTGL